MRMQEINHLRKVLHGIREEILQIEQSISQLIGVILDLEEKLMNEADKELENEGK